MPRALTDAEFAAFTATYPQYNAVSPSFSMVPGESDVVNWNNTGQIVLVYCAYDQITQSVSSLSPADALISEESGGADTVSYADVYYTDISDSPQLATALANQPPTQTILGSLTQAAKDTIATGAQQVGAMVNSLGQTLKTYLTSGLSAAEAAGQAAFDAVMPWIAGILLAYLLLK